MKNNPPEKSRRIANSTMGRARTALLENAQRPHPLGMTALAAESEIKLRTLYQARKQLWPTASQQQQLNTNRSHPGNTTLLTREGRLASLTQLATEGDIAQRARIIIMIDEMMRAEGQGVGPPPPQTDAERARNLAEMLRACDAPVVRHALELYKHPATADPIPPPTNDAGSKVVAAFNTGATLPTNDFNVPEPSAEVAGGETVGIVSTTQEPDHASEN